MADVSSGWWTWWCQAGVGLFLAAGVTGSGCATRTAEDDGSPEAVVRSFFERLNSHDVSAALNLLDEEFVFRSAGGDFEATKSDMPAMLAWDVEAEGRTTVQAFRSSGDTVRARMVERNRFTELLDLKPWTFEGEFIVRDGKILEETVREVTLEDNSFPQRFERALRRVRDWAIVTRPGEANQVFEDGRVVSYNGPTARRLLDLIQAYRREVGSGL